VASITWEVIAAAATPHYRQVMAATMTPQTITRPIGDLLREWRERRRLSQLALALDAEVSARHVSFLETGRSQPSREMVLRLAERLEVPLRDRNTLLLAAGYAPLYPERRLDDPSLAPARAAIERVLAGHEPYPALAVDRQWTLVAANGTVPLLLQGISPELLRPPVNVLRLSLHEDGLAPRIANLAEWRAHLLARLGRQVEMSADANLASLLEELQGYPLPETSGGNDSDIDPLLAGVAVPLRLRTAYGTLSFLSTTMIFGTPVDVTLSELAIEAFFPADAATTGILNQLTAETNHQEVHQ
jgi:transcriptional regulator with XRE-family HTH domain